jgi:hypothetical protein
LAELVIVLSMTLIVAGMLWHGVTIEILRREGRNVSGRLFDKFYPVEALIVVLMSAFGSDLLLRELVGRVARL